jgi:hypothetical protein
MSGLGWRIDKAEKALAIPSPEDIALAKGIVQYVRRFHEWALAGMTCAPCAIGLGEMARRLNDNVAVLEAIRKDDLSHLLADELDRAMPHECCHESLSQSRKTGGPPAAPHECQASDMDRQLSTDLPPR